MPGVKESVQQTPFQNASRRVLTMPAAMESTLFQTRIMGKNVG